MVRALRPGGRVILEDDGHDVLRLWPEPPGVIALWNAYIQTYVEAGNDPFVGHKLASLLFQGGAIPVRIDWIFFGSCARQDVFRVQVQNLVEILTGAKDRLLQTGKVSPPSFDAAMSALGAWARLPEAAMWYAISWAEGVRPMA
jgi:hypothetical protein